MKFKKLLKYSLICSGLYFSTLSFASATSMGIPDPEYWNELRPSMDEYVLYGEYVNVDIYESYSMVNDFKNYFFTEALEEKLNKLSDIQGDIIDRKDKIFNFNLVKDLPVSQIYGVSKYLAGSKEDELKPTEYYENKINVFKEELIVLEKEEKSLRKEISADLGKVHLSYSINDIEKLYSLKTANLILERDVLSFGMSHFLNGILIDFYQSKSKALEENKDLVLMNDIKVSLNKYFGTGALFLDVLKNMDLYFINKIKAYNKQLDKIYEINKADLASLEVYKSNYKDFKIVEDSIILKIESLKKKEEAIKLYKEILDKQIYLLEERIREIKNAHYEFNIKYVNKEFSDHILTDDFLRNMRSIFDSAADKNLHNLSKFELEDMKEDFDKLSSELNQ